MTRKHYDSPKLRRYERRKLIRRSFRYRYRRWARRVGPRIDAISGYVRWWALATLATYFVFVYASGPGSGLLPSPWDEVVCFIGGVLVVAGQAWNAFSEGIKKSKK